MLYQRKFEEILEHTYFENESFFNQPEKYLNVKNKEEAIENSTQYLQRFKNCFSQHYNNQKILPEYQSLTQRFFMKNINIVMKGFELKNKNVSFPRLHPKFKTYF